MASIKTITRKPGVRRFLCWLGAQYIRLVYKSGRWETRRGDIPQRFIDANEPFIAGFWHGRLMMMPYAWTSPKTFHTLISEHPDGRLIADTIAHFGFGAIAGSSTRGGTAALRQILKALNEGAYAGITPDGPRGPRMRATEGIVTIARLAGAPVIPVSFGAARRRVLNTWDRFVLALPFSRGVIVWGDPVSVPRDADEYGLEEARRRIEDAINAVTDEADILCGCAPVEPAALNERAAS
ncbi:MAG: lysophospholipid acyltransferase family protein [Rhodospirillales bacterium]